MISPDFEPERAPKRSKFKNLKLKLAAALGIVGSLVVAVGGGDKGTQAQTLENKRIAAPTSLVQPIEADQIVNGEVNIGYYEIHFNANNTPIWYNQNGQQHNFSAEEIDTFAKIQQSAKDTQDYQLLTVLRAPAPVINPSFTPSPDRPAVTELPKDVMTDDELQAMGIVQIIQSDNTHLYIRRVNFEPGGLMYDLAQAQKLPNPPKLRIVLVNAPVVSAEAMADPRYDAVRHFLVQSDQSVADLKQKEIEFIQQMVAQNRDFVRNTIKLGDTQLTPAAITQLETSLFDQDDLQNGPADMLTEKLNTVTSDRMGIYFTPEADNVSTIFIAVGKAVATEQEIAIFARPDGQVDVTGRYQGNPRADFSPSMSRGFPRPSDFGVDPNATHDNGHYPFGAQPNEPGEDLNHEFGHEKLMELQKVPDPNEYDTDQFAMNVVKRAADAWLNHGDDSGYGLVFAAPGGYMLTDFKKTANDENQPDRQQA